NGFGKRSDPMEYRQTARGAKGVKTLNITEKTGKLVAIKNVTDQDDLMIICKSGMTIRMPVATIRVAGRATQGVKLINIKDGDAIAAVSVVNHSDEEESTPAVAQDTAEPQENNQ
ncbi:MAG: DNA gyrase subunit A, partial [Selenomonadaceae bacterium]|nr:DNA gyrase subunit A [Selenomonadaceae bacterium]